MCKRRERHGALVGLLFCLLVIGTYCINDRLKDNVDAAEAEVEVKAAGRRLKQNPDRPALNAYGGVNMTTMLASGYPLESYKVNTPDGWVLTLYRIPYGKKRHNTPGKRPVIYLHHGITLSSGCFTVLNEDESMAYILADAGFDVWLPNTRGNVFSRGNYQYSHREHEYWYHSIDEYALIDNPVMIDKALEVSGASKLAFVGHSQGASIGYALLSEKPEYNDKISVLLQMGPVVYNEFFQTPFMKAMASVGNDRIMPEYARSGEFLWTRSMVPFVPQCKSDFLAEGCVATLGLIFFGPSIYVSVDDYSVIAQTWPSSVASRNLQHWAQMYYQKNLRFQMFDHGTNCTLSEPFKETCNQMKYGSLRPPEYDLSKITANVVVFEGEMDIMATVDDMREQRRRLTNANLIEIVYQTYGHMDFIWDRNARHMLDLVDMAFRFAPGTF